MGTSFANALKGFQESRDLDVTGELDEVTRQALARWDYIPATRLVTIPQSWGEIEFSEVPEDPAQQAEIKRLGYKNMSEAPAERFHTAPDVLAQLNPSGQPASLRVGTRCRLAVLSHQPPIRRLTAAVDPDPVVHDCHIECLIPPKAASPLSGSRIDPTYDRRWVDC